ncbi:MAG: inorganic phosphate transporter [Chloroflexi bacterium]|jgi:PiT family inorganic phosphate transporter|nr:inorganic phosphate transporter [Chloroflexota bacterium]OJW05697.1 MAG: anion permease [Chloroflexi bacterium 54-19]
MDGGFILLLAVIIIATIFDFINGFHDSANAIATVVATRVLSPFVAVSMAAIFNFIGAFTGTSVAKTVGQDIVDPSNSSQLIVIGALLGAITWNLITWYWGLPSSSSHALIGGLIGASLAGNGFNLAILKGEGIGKVVAGLIFSPIAGFIGAYLIMTLLNWLLVRSTPHFVNKWFKRLQLFSSAFMAFSHGGNDAQKTMAIITLAIITYEKHPTAVFQVPVWVIVLAALAMGSGTLAGGWRIIKTMGARIVKLQPVHGFAAETSAATVIEVASRLGFPLSTTHVIGSAIMGVGANRRLTAVNWNTASNIIKAWIITIPACIFFGIIFELIIDVVF